MMSEEREKEMESEVQENRHHRHDFRDEEPFCHFCMLRETLADRDELKARVVALEEDRAIRFRPTKWFDYRKRCDRHWPKPFKDKRTGVETSTDVGFIHADESECAECEIMKPIDSIAMSLARATANTGKPS